jgi:hypothetical protein
MKTKELTGESEMKSIKSKWVLCAIALSLIAVVVVPVMGRVSNGRVGKSIIGHLYLFEKDNATWEIIEDGAWGKMLYLLSGPDFCFVFNGHGLEPEREYTLIYYPDPWPGNCLISLGTGTANAGGNVHIMGRAVDTGDLPAPHDDNCPLGAKIWLVWSEDVAYDPDAEDPNTNMMVGWHGPEYLFEYDLITFDDTDE